MRMMEGNILNLQRYSILSPILYHCTARVNLPCIEQTRVLWSAAALAPDRAHTVRDRPEPVKFGCYVVTLCDQRALRPGQMQLTDGSLQGFLVALSSRVFFWPGDQDRPNDYGQNFIDKYSARGQHPTVLRVAFLPLLQTNPGVTAYFCKFNSGAPRMWNGRKSPRGQDTFQTAEEWSGWPSDVAEVSFLHKVILPDCTEVREAGAGWRPL
jgi:hypothetical protein